MSRSCALVSGLVAALALVGWGAGIGRLTSVSPRYPTMVPNTAVALLLASLASWLLATPATTRVRLGAARAAALVVLGIGAVSVLEHVIGPLGVDQLLFSVPPSIMAHPGRPALVTAAALVAVSASLLLLGQWQRRGIQLSDVAACVTGIAALEGLASYLYGAAPLYGLPGELPQPGMSLPTALALSLLTVSVLLARPDVGLAGVMLSPLLGGVVARRLLLVGSLLPLLGLIVLGGEKQGFYGEPVAASILTTAALALGLVAVTATGLELNKLDAAQKQAWFEKARLAALVESSTEAITSATPDGVVLTWNRAAERMYGYSASEIQGDPGAAARVVPADRRGETPALLARLRRGERVEDFRTIRRRKNGELFHASLTLWPLFDERGEVIGISTIVRDITPRIRAEQALRESEERYRQLFELAPDGVFIADVSGRYTDVNGAGCALLGYTRDELVSKTIMDIIPPEDIPRLEANRQRLIEGHVSVEEWKLRRKDGTFVPAEVSAKILPSGVWQGFARDISERARAEAALRQAHATEQRLRTRIEAVNQASLITAEAVVSIPEHSLERTLEVIVEQARRLTGASYAALGLGGSEDAPFAPWVFSGMTPEEVARIGRPPRPVGVLGTVLRTAGPVCVADLRAHEDSIGLPPGHPEMQAFLGQPIRYRDRVLGNLYLANRPGAPAFTSDDAATMALLAARAAIAIHTAHLYEQEALGRVWLRTVIDQMPEGIILLDATGRTTLINAAAMGLAASTTGEQHTYGEPPFDVRRPSGEPVPDEELPLTRAFSRHEIVQAEELRVRRADGRLVPVLASAAPVRDDSGKILGAALNIQDITLLKELDRLREEWTSVIAHDLRQPVSVVMMSASLLARCSELSERDRTHVARIQNAAGRLRTMIDDLLAASQLEADRLTLDRTFEDPAELVERVIEHLRPVLGGRKVELTLDGPFRAVLVDPGRIEQVLGNLLSNAVKYGYPDSDIHVTVADEGDAVELGVTNRGPGIAADELSELFGRFRRSGTARRSGIAGIGLGLYICKGLIEAHGGHIQARSTPGEQTTFAFTLPYSPEHAEAQSA